MDGILSILHAGSWITLDEGNIIAATAHLISGRAS
jgi:hypothetical protein